jgi:hypothetical protein
VNTKDRIPMDENEIRAHSRVFSDKYLVPVRDGLGVGALNEFGLRMAEAHESYLRENQPENPLLELLDTYRDLQGRKERFE